MLKKFHGIIFLLIIILAVLVRLLYITYAGDAITIEPDSQGYYTKGNFFTEDFLHNYFNANRMPGYPMFTSILISASGYGHPPYLSNDFFMGSWYIILAQTVIGVAGLFILYDLLRAIGLSQKWSLAFMLFTSLNVYQFIWEHAFLNYALYITLLTIILRLFVALLKKPTSFMGSIFVLVSGYAFLVRPAGIGIPFLLLLFVWFRHKTKKVFMLLATMLFVYSLFPLSHIVANRMLYNVKGLANSTDFVPFGRILKYNIPIDSAQSVQPLYNEVVEYRRIGGNVSIPWYFFVYYNDRIYSHLDEVQRFNSLVIRKYWFPYTATIIGDIPEVFFNTDVSGVLYHAPTPSISRTFFDTLAWIYASLQQMTFIFFIIFPISLWFYIKKQTVLHTFLLAIGTVQLYQIILTPTIGGSWDFAGHMITTQTYLFFFCFWGIITIVQSIKSRFRF